MVVDTSDLLEELRKTKQNLSEVIDECVFVERQRDLTEQHLTAELRDRDRLVSDTLSSLMSLIEYLSLLERRVIIPALGTFSSIVKKVPEIGEARSSSIERVEGTLSAHNSPHFRGILSKIQPLGGENESEIRRILLENSISFSMEEAYVLIRALLAEKENLIERINKTVFNINSVLTETYSSRSISVTRSDEIRELRQKVATLTHELQIRNNEKREAAHRFAVLQKAIEGENKNIEELNHLRDIIERQEKTIELLRLSSNGSSIGAKLDVSPLSKVNNGINEEEIHEEETISILKANEITIGALNKELAIMEENYRSLEKRSTKECEELKAELAYTRNKYREEQEECDAVLGRITMELEQLVRENAQLKKRLREIYAKKVPQTNNL